MAAFADLARAMAEEDELREGIIKRSRDAQKHSKVAIYALQRGDTRSASAHLADAKAIFQRDLLPVVERNPTLRYGALSGALEEYAEAVIFASFLSSGRVPGPAELEIVNKEEYLGGVMDFTGELNRYAVLRATARDLPAVWKCRDVVDQLTQALMEFNWRNGNLRRKYDALKYTLRKMEQILYELNLTQATGIMPKSGSEDPPMPPTGAAEGAEDGADADGGEAAMEEDAGDGAAETGGGRGGRRGGKRPRPAGPGRQ